MLAGMNKCLQVLARILGMPLAGTHDGPDNGFAKPDMQ
jgi:hypothetical protein